tara:strand:- start:5276 stop:6184 length:909 start_codon:yes stop_codon:yes gene_type:complete
MSIMNIARRKYQEGGDAGTYAPGTPAPFLLPFGEALADYTMSELQQPIDIGAISPKVSYMNPLIQEALQKQATQAGLGNIQFDPNTGEVTGVGAGTGVAAYQPYLDKAEAAADPGAYKTYMSPYQTEVLDSTKKLLAEQRAAGEGKAAEAAIASGAFGGGREGVQRAEYTRQRDIYDAGIMSKLRQEGLQQAQQLQQQSLKNQLGLGQAQAGFQSGITSGLGAAGTGAQAYSQSILDAIQQQNMLGQQFPMQKIGSAANIFAGVAGGIPGQVQPPITTSPGLTGIQTFGSIFGGLGNLVRGR